MQAARLKVMPPVETDRAGRIKVNHDFSIAAHPKVFVVGDIASFEIAPQATLPGLAPVAIQGGRHVAEMILSDLAGRPRRPFSYRATKGKWRQSAGAARLVRLDTLR